MIGRAASTDLANWTLLPNVFNSSDNESFDDMATWTGSVVKGPDQMWYMFYTGISKKEDGRVQRIGLATSSDLYSWERCQDFLPLSADPRFYEKFGESKWPNETWRDPWVFEDPDGNG